MEWTFYLTIGIAYLQAALHHLIERRFRSGLQELLIAVCYLGLAMLKADYGIQVFKLASVWIGLPA